MKKFVKIISVVMCALLLVTGFFFAPKNMNSFMLSTHAATTQADLRSTGQTYNYEAIVDSSSSDIPDYAIDNIEYIQYDSHFLIHFTCTLSQWTLFARFYDMAPPSAGRDYFKYIAVNFVNSSYFNVNFLVVPKTNNFYFEPGSVSGSTGSAIVSDASKVVLDIYFSNWFFIPSYNSSSGVVSYELVNSFYVVNDDTTFSVDSTFSISDSDFSALYDMSSDTNYSFNFNSFSSGNDALSYFLQHYKNSYFELYSSSVQCYVYFYAGGVAAYQQKCSSFWFRFYTPALDYFRYYLSDLYFYIYEPSFRVNNTLIIYNFDYYNYLSYSSGVSYTLRKGNDLYNISYSGSLPNYKYLYVYNESIQNTIFDEYILFYLNFQNGYLNYFDFYDESSNSLSFALGFDFNFTYYTQPLVASNGSYNYVFNKPGYVDMEFSLYPFHIPVLEAVENAMIFLLFYCPITSDIVELLNFDRFMGGLIQIFNMFIDSQIGNFIMGAFAFLILWGILSSLLPKVLSSARSIYSNSQFVYNRRRNREDRQKERLQQKEVKYTQKMIKVDERYNKRRRKKE